jgi:hypothetical protein
MDRQRLQHYGTPKPFNHVSYGIYIESLLAGERQTEDESRFESEGGRSAPPPPRAGGVPAERRGDLAALRRNARIVGREELIALVEARGWTPTTSMSYAKDGWPRLEIPEAIGPGDALAVINAVQAESAAGGE